jgi:hypothetical protein
MRTTDSKARMLLFDPQGPLITAQDDVLDIKGGRLDEIEASVSAFREAVLPEREQRILEHEQAEYIKNPADLSCNGTNTVTIKTRHGAFEFQNQRFKGANGREADSYFTRAGHTLHHQCTRGLEEQVGRDARDTT